MITQRGDNCKVRVQAWPDARAWLVLAAVDSHAAKLGPSRNEYLRRQLAQDAMRSTAPAAMADLRDLADPDVMRQAWE